MTVTLPELARRLTDAVLTDPENRVQPEYALRPELVGVTYFDAPVVGCAAAEDPIFPLYKSDPKILGRLTRLPGEWLPGARSVVSFFLPYTEEVRRSNLPDISAPSAMWLHARIEGQAFLMKMCELLAGRLREAGHRAVIPAGHPDFRAERDPGRAPRGEPVYASTWSERHAAYAAGLGTFSLSKHIITEKGVCGRFGSVITDAPLGVTPRKYTEPYEYCTFCGSCVPRCPAGAISVEGGKDNLACAAFLDGTAAAFAPRYGCGKCQLAVPCEAGVPGGLGAGSNI